jgi:hypothetical protein
MTRHVLKEFKIFTYARHDLSIVVDMGRDESNGLREKGTGTLES